MIPRLIATDLDGTLLDATHAVSAATRDVLSEVDALGIPVVVATGRGPQVRFHLAESLPTVRYFVCLQGSAVIDQHTGQISGLQYLAREAARKAVELIEGAVGPVQVASENVMDAATALRGEPDFAWPFDYPLEHVDREAVLAEDPMKIIVSKHDMPVDEFVDAARQAVPPELGTVLYGGFGMVDVVPAGVSKASGVARVAELLGVDAADVLAFGDMPNDVPLLTWAGRAVAVGNAHPEVLALADAVAGTNDEDGVASYLAEHVLGRA